MLPDKKMTPTRTARVKQLWLAKKAIFTVEYRGLLVTGTREVHYTPIVYCDSV